MGKKEKLAKINKTASGECLDNLALLENLVSNAQSCPTSCSILIRMVKERTEKVFKKIEKTRKILNITN